jgi:hypothetical protein
MFQGNGRIEASSSGGGGGGGTIRAFDAGAKTVFPGAGRIPLVSLRLAAAAVHAPLRLARLKMLNAETGVARWQLLMNPALTGARFSSVGPDAYAEVSCSEIAAEGGELIGGGYVSLGETVADLTASDVRLFATIGGASDVVTVAVTHLRGVVIMDATLEWLEGGE